MNKFRPPMKKIIIAAFAVSAVFVACKKDKKTTTAPPKPIDSVITDTNYTASRYEALTTDKWRLSEVYMNDTAGKEVVEYYSGMKECEKDNFFTFNKNASITSDEGATKCDPSVDQVTTGGTWLLSSDTTQFTLKETTILPIKGDINAKIVTIDKYNFKISKDTTITFGAITIKGTIFSAFKKVK
jgi:hypothetical protein